MNTLIWLIFTGIATAIASKRTIYRNHTCAPSSGFTGICVLGSLHYDFNQKHVIHSFPQNQSHVRITCDSQGFGHYVQVLYIDSEFYKMIGRPETLELVDYAVFSLEIARTLRHASFRNSYLRSFTVELGDDDPKIRYLDLSGNGLTDISPVESLVNLEVLLLSSNRIRSIDPTTMKNLTKLKYLSLSENVLTDVSLGIFPKSLTQLELFDCKINSLNYEDFNYPNLETLNIEQNHLTSIDGQRLIQSMPKLKTARIGWNHYQVEDSYDLLETIKIFKAHNITFRNGADEAACEEGSGSVEGVCLAELDLLQRSVLPDILMSLAVIGVAIVLVALLRWVLIAMISK